MCLNCGPAGSPEQQEIKILVVHSYRIEYSWTKSIDDGINYVFRDKNYRVEKFFMETKQNTGIQYMIKTGHQALRKVKSFKPAVVICTDDNAQEYVGRFLVNRDGMSVVFCGVNADAAAYGYPGGNVTGVLERPQVRSSLNLLRKVSPGFKTAVIFTDKGPTSSGFIRYVQSLNLDIRIQRVIEIDDFTQWKKEFQAVHSDVIITYMYHTVRDNDAPVDSEVVMAWTAAHMDRPTVGFLDFAVEDGVLLGQVESGFEHGELAARKTVEIINGKKAAEIPITTARKGLVMINEKTARTLGIDMTPIINVTDKVFK